MQSAFEWKRQTTPLTMSQIMDFTAHNQDALRADALINSMNQRLYGDNPEIPQIAKWQRIKRLCSIYRERVVDAWLVLTGRASIGDC